MSYYEKVAGPYHASLSLSIRNGKQPVWWPQMLRCAQHDMAANVFLMIFHDALLLWISLL